MNLNYDNDDDTKRSGKNLPQAKKKIEYEPFVQALANHDLCENMTLFTYENSRKMKTIQKTASATKKADFIHLHSDDDRLYSHSVFLLFFLFFCHFKTAFYLKTL